MTYGELILVFCSLATLPGVLLVQIGALRVRFKLLCVAGVLLVLVALTIIFDSLIIAAGFVEYNQTKLSGITLWKAPVEDISYVLAGSILLPVLWWIGEHPERAKSQIFTWMSTSRPVSWVNTAYPFAAAYFLTTGKVDDVLIVGTLFFLIPYNFLMYGINDVFDYESDLRNPRKGGLEGVVIDRSQHRGILAASVALTLPFTLYLLFVGDYAATVVLIISLFAVIAYSIKGLRFKEKPFLDAATSATHFVSPMVYGLMIAKAEWNWTLVAITSAFFLWGMASQAFGAVQDIQADRAGGIRSIATVLGARATVWNAAAMYLAAGVVLLFTPQPATGAALCVLPYIANMLPFLAIDDATCEQAHQGWKRFLWINYVVGFVVTMLLIQVKLGG